MRFALLAYKNSYAHTHTEKINIYIYKYVYIYTHIYMFIHVFNGILGNFVVCVSSLCYSRPPLTFYHSHSLFVSALRARSFARRGEFLSQLSVTAKTTHRPFAPSLCPCLLKFSLFVFCSLYIKWKAFAFPVTLSLLSTSTNLGKLLGKPTCNLINSVCCQSGSIASCYLVL